MSCGGVDEISDWIDTQSFAASYSDSGYTAPGHSYNP